MGEKGGRISLLRAALRWIGGVLVAIGLLPLVHSTVSATEEIRLSDDYPTLQPWSTTKLTKVLEAAQAGNATAQYYLGREYLLGSKVTADPAEAFRWMALAADQGLPEAQFTMGLKCEWGLFGTNNYPQALKWYQAAAEKGLVAAQFKMGSLHIHDQPAVRTQLATGEIVTAPYVTMNYVQTVKWLRLASEQGFPAAQILLSKVYANEFPFLMFIKPRSNGSWDPTKEERLEGLKWFFAAKAQGEPEAEQLQQPFKKIRDETLSLEAREQAKAFTRTRPPKNWLPAYEMLYFLNPQGSDLDKDLSRTRFVQLLQAATQGDAHSQYLLGLCYQFEDCPFKVFPSHGTATNVASNNTPKAAKPSPKQEAVHWYELAAKQGYLPAQLGLGYLLFNQGPDSEKRIEAVKWFRLAAEHGYAPAQFQLGVLHQDGQGVPRDYAEAVKWIQKAADQSYTPALQKLHLADAQAKRVPAPIGPATDTTSPAPSAPAGPDHPFAIRLAVLSADSSVDNLADLLMTRLSANPSLTLLERDQINKIMQEQALSAGNQRDYLKLGQTLGADGILLLEPVRRDGKLRLSIRLVAVGIGAVLDWVEYPLPPPDTSAWSQFASDHFSGKLSKLSVPPKEIIPLSILNLRSAVASPAAESLERELTLLLAHRLSHEKDVVVLERRKMDSLDREKFFAGLEHASFWNGGYLLDGTLNKNGFQTNTVTLNIRLTPPNGGQPVLIDMIGTPDQLPKLVNELAKKILSTLHQQSNPAIWSPLVEAAKYYEEARWALNWQMYPEAQAAADAGWALGLHTLEMAILRVKSNGEQVKLEKVTQQGDNAYIVVRDTDRPDLKYIGPARRALKYYLDCSHDSGFKSEMNAQWSDVGKRELEITAGLLSGFTKGPDLDPAFFSELADLRAQARETLSILDTLPDGQAQTLSLHCLQSAYFQDQPEQSAKIYKDLIENGSYRQFAWENRDRKKFTPVLAGWTIADRHRTWEIWQTLFKTLSQSTNSDVRLEGAILAVRLSESDYQKEEALATLMHLAWEERQRIFSEEMGQSLVMDLKSALIYSSSGQETPVGERLEQKVLPAFRQRLADAEKAFKAESKVIAAQKNEADRKALIKSLADDLKADPPKHPDDIVSKYIALHFSASEASELVPLLPAYRAKWPAMPQRFTALEWNLTNATSAHPLPIPVPNFSRIMNSPGVPMAALAQLGYTRAGPWGAVTVNNQGQKKATNAPIRISQFWFPTVKSSPGKIFDEKWLHMLGWRSGRIWLQADFRENLDYYNPEYRTFYCGVKPETGETLVIEGSRRDSSKWAISILNFEVYQNYLLVNDGTGFRKYDLQRGEWSPIHINLPDGRHLVPSENHLYCTTDDSILELDLAKEAAKVLASCRRQPPVTSLDSKDRLGSPPLFITAQHQPGVFIDGNVYCYQPDRQDWTVIGTFPNARPWHPLCVPGQKLLLHPWNLGPRCFAFSEQPGTNSGSFAEIKFTEELQKAGQGYVNELCNLAPDGDDVWLLANATQIPFNQSAAQPEDNQPLPLVFYQGRQAHFHVLPVLLDFSKTAQARKFLLSNSISRDRIKLAATPEGLAIFDSSAGGFWYLPKKSLAPLLAQQDQQVLIQQRQRLEIILQHQNLWLQLFDINHNGVLDPPEMEAMKRNARYQQEQQELVDLRKLFPDAAAKPAHP